MYKKLTICILLIVSFSCRNIGRNTSKEIRISKDEYANKLQGFWLGQCIANWTGLVTEMDKIGNIGEIKTGEFYTRENWGKPDFPSIWGEGIPSNLSDNIDFVIRNQNEVWGADDDTDIEYMYQHLMDEHKTSKLTPEQIQKGWLKHIHKEEENYLWVSNETAFKLMHKGLLPPETSNPELNKDTEMIDAQLTTEIFGLFAPTNPTIAKEIAHLPIRTVARNKTAEISEFYVTMYSLSSKVDHKLSLKDQVLWLADEASKGLTKNKYPYKMFQYVKSKYESGITWEQARDSIYQRYQVEQHDGYDLTSKNLYCNGCFAGGINFAASLISLFYGEGDIKETIKIGTLAGWDSDNPTATWGGLLGFMYGKEKVEQVFGQKMSDKFNIHRTRKNFLKGGVDTFSIMAKTGVRVTEKVIIDLMNGKLDTVSQEWVIPQKHHSNYD